MSHFIHTNNVISALFQRYKDHNIEYTACALLQNLVILSFPISEGYANTFEQPPDQGLTRMDVLTLDLRDSRLVPTMIFEVKGGGNKSVKDCETQALRYAQATIKHHRLPGIYVCTFIGKESDIDFACWVVDAVEKILQPADHSPKPYTSLSNDPEHRLWHFWEHVKSHQDQPQVMLPPQNQAPSQPVYDASEPVYNPNQYVYQSDEDIYDAPDPDTYDQPNVYAQESSLHNQPTQDQPGSQAPLSHESASRQPAEGSTVDDSEAEESDDEGEEDDEPGSPAAGPSQAYSTEYDRPQLKQVTITKVTHMFHSTEYTFKKRGRDGKKRKVSTKKEDWRRVRTATRGVEAWYWKENEKYWGYMGTD